MHVHGKYCFVCNMFTGDLKLFCSLRRSFHLVSKLTGDTALLITMKPSVESLQSWRMLTCHPAFFFFFFLPQAEHTKSKISPFFSLSASSPFMLCSGEKKTDQKEVYSGRLRAGHGCSGLAPQPPEALRWLILVTELAYCFKTHRSQTTRRN